MQRTYLTVVAFAVIARAAGSDKVFPVCSAAAADGQHVVHSGSAVGHTCSTIHTLVHVTQIEIVFAVARPAGVVHVLFQHDHCRHACFPAG